MSWGWDRNHSGWCHIHRSIHYWTWDDWRKHSGINRWTCSHWRKYTRLYNWLGTDRPRPDFGDRWTFNHSWFPGFTTLRSWTGWSRCLSRILRQLLYSATVPVNTIVVYDNVFVNLGSGYNSGRGVFTVPTGGAGLYYFFAHFAFDHNQGEFASFAIRKNGAVLALAFNDDIPGSGDTGSSSCGATTVLQDDRWNIFCYVLSPNVFNIFYFFHGGFWIWMRSVMYKYCFWNISIADDSFSSYFQATINCWFKVV